MVLGLFFSAVLLHQFIFLLLLSFFLKKKGRKLNLCKSSTKKNRLINSIMNYRSSFWIGEEMEKSLSRIEISKLETLLQNTAFVCILITIFIKHKLLVFCYYSKYFFCLNGVFNLAHKDNANAMTDISGCVKVCISHTLTHTHTHTHTQPCACAHTYRTQADFLIPNLFLVYVTRPFLSFT